MQGARFDLGVSYSDYRWERIADCPGSSRSFFSHLSSRFSRMQSAFEYAFPDKMCFGCRNSLIIIFIAAPQPGNSGSIDNIEMFIAKFSAQDHDFLQSLVFINMVGFR